MKKEPDNSDISVSTPLLLMPGLQDLAGGSRQSTCSSWRGQLSIFGAGERTRDCTLWDLRREECAFLASSGAGRCPLSTLVRKESPSMSTRAQNTAGCRGTGRCRRLSRRASGDATLPPTERGGGDAPTARALRPRASVASADLGRG